MKVRAWRIESAIKRRPCPVAPSTRGTIAVVGSAGRSKPRPYKIKEVRD